MQNKLKRGALATLVSAMLVSAMLVTPAMAAPLSDDAAVQLLQRLNDMEQEVNGLRGENEKLRHDMENMQKSQKEDFKPVDEHTADLKDKADDMLDKPLNAADKADDKLDKPLDTADKPAIAKDDPSSFYSYGTGKSDDKNPVISKASDTTEVKSTDKPADKPAETPEAKTEADKPADKTDKPDTSSTGKEISKALPEREERSVYNDAFQTLLQEPKEAVPAFRTFLKDYPKSSLAPSAQYWIGEALYSDKDYKGAEEEFLTVLKDYKGSDKAPDAALKLGYCFYELKEWDKARKTLEDVISFFPDNAETTKLAKERLDKMKTEGH
jgi:tol-pal system protein YbgF